jgi:hypothetical protein
VVAVAVAHPIETVAMVALEAVRELLLEAELREQAHLVKVLQVA